MIGDKMKDKLVRLEDGLEYYILEDITVDKKKYCIAIQVNEEHEDVMDKFIICEAKLINGNVFLDDINNIDDKERISNLLLYKMEKNKQGDIV